MCDLVLVKRKKKKPDWEFKPDDTVRNIGEYFPNRFHPLNGLIAFLSFSDIIKIDLKSDPYLHSNSTSLKNSLT